MIDKRITPRFIRYQQADLWMGIVVVVTGAAALMGAAASAFAGPGATGTSPIQQAAGFLEEQDQGLAQAGNPVDPVTHDLSRAACACRRAGRLVRH